MTLDMLADEIAMEIVSHTTDKILVFITEDNWERVHKEMTERNITVYSNQAFNIRGVHYLIRGVPVFFNESLRGDEIAFALRTEA